MKSKNFTLFILISLLFSSCENKEKYYGEWMMTPPYELVNQAEKIIITKDSVFIASFPFHKFYSESLKFKGNKLKLFNESFRLKIENDSLLHFNNSTYIKKGYDFYNLVNHINLISIEYPEIESTTYLSDKNYPLIYFGKKINSNEFTLQLNDKIAEIRDLRQFLNPGHHPFYGVSLTADKNSKMKDINDIFYYIKSINIRKVKLINDINYYYEQHGMILSSEEGLYIYLNDFEEESLIQKDSEPTLIPRPPTPRYYSLRKTIKNSKQVVISLIKNELFFELKKVNKKELLNLVLHNFQDNYFIILYDDESTYKNYLELMNIYNKASDEIRDVKSNEKFNKPFHSLEREEKNEIIYSIPKYLLTGISYKDFEKLNIKIPELKLMN